MKQQLEHKNQWHHCFILFHKLKKFNWAAEEKITYTYSLELQEQKQMFLRCFRNGIVSKFLTLFVRMRSFCMKKI